MSENQLGPVLDRLAAVIAARKGASADQSYTASLLAAGVERCAKKFGEEAIEAALASVSSDKDALAAEAGDVLYHLLVLLESAGVSTEAVADVLAARDGVSGHDEKASRGN